MCGESDVVLLQDLLDPAPYGFWIIGPDLVQRAMGVDYVVLRHLDVRMGPPVLSDHLVAYDVPFPQNRTRVWVEKVSP